MRAIGKILMTIIICCALAAHAQSAFDTAWSDEASMPALSADKTNLSHNVRVAWKKRYMSEHLSSDDIAAAMAIDPATGAVLVTGHSFNTTSGLDIFTIKYDGSGRRMWTARFDGPGHGSDYAAAIGIDRDGNVIVVGSCWSGVSFDFVTIKYNAAGEQQWLKSYNNNLWKSTDTAKLLALDARDNIYVAGIVGKDTSSSATVVIKYTPEGEEKWVARFGFSIGAPTSMGLTVDMSGEVYFATWVNNHERIIKLTPDGEQEWFIDLQERGWSGLRGLVLDNFGSLYLLRYDRNFGVIKLNSQREAQWTTAAAAGDPVGFAIDDSLQIYVTAAINNQYLTVKYDSTGQEKWQAVFKHPVDELESYPSGLAVDNSGNAYVTGRSGDLQNYNSELSLTTVKYDGNGVQQWVNHFRVSPRVRDWKQYFDPIRLRVDSFGNAHVLGTMREAGCDYVTIKCDSQGQILWSDRYSGPGSGNDFVQDMAIDRHGNAYVLGNSYVREGFGNVYDFVTIKYSAAGEELWRKRYTPASDCPGNYAVALKLDRWGNVYIAGTNYDSATRYDFLTIKYDGSGKEQWRVRHDFSWDLATALEVDDRGNVYVTGSGNDDVYQSAFATVKYDSSGKLLWARLFNSDPRYSYVGKAIAVDDSGNVYVAGKRNLDYAVIKYDKAGNKLWEFFYVATGEITPSALAVLPSGMGGGVCVSGKGLTFVATLRISADGKKIWDAIDGFRYPSAYSNLALDERGCAHVTANGLTVKYDWEGKRLWRTSFGGKDIALDGKGNVYVTGVKVRAGNGNDILTIKYDSEGKMKWEFFYNGPEKFQDYPIALEVDGAANIILSGVSGYTYYPCDLFTWNGVSRAFFVTIKYKQTDAAAIAEPQVDAPTESSLSQNHPNPFNPSTTIRYALGQTSRVTLKIYNLAGQEVATLVDDYETAGEHEIKWTPANLASGVYLYRLLAGDFVETKKLVLLQ